MSELVIDLIASLDGYGSADGWPGWWGIQGPESLAWLGDHREADRTVLMAANTYRLTSGVAEQGELGTDALGDASKIVCSNTLTEPLTRANTQPVRGDAAAAVRAMKNEAIISMHTMGSLSPCRSLVRAGLADRFRRSCSRLSPGAPVGSGSMTDIPTSRCGRSSTGPSTGDPTPRVRPDHRGRTARARHLTS